MHQPSALSKAFADAATKSAYFAGKPITFLICVLIILVWGITGPFFDFSNTWQLMINTGTTISTFLMVFLIQNTQNRDGAAIQAKLDELILEGSAQNRFVGIEALTDDEIAELREKCKERAKAENAHTRAPA